MVVTGPPAHSQEVTRFRQEAGEAGTLRELAALFSAATLPFGITGYAIGHLAGGDRPVTMMLTTWSPALMELYAMHAMFLEDPIVRGALEDPRPFTWEEAKVRQGYTSHRVLTAFMRFGFLDGFAVPIHGPGDARGLVALLASRLRVTDHNRQAVVEICRICHAVARRLYDRRAVSTRLAPRERQALTLVAQGLDDAAIGAALGVTRTSAHVYVERAKRRLGATTRAQAVALAITQALL